MFRFFFVILCNHAGIGTFVGVVKRGSDFYFRVAAGDGGDGGDQSDKDTAIISEGLQSGEQVITSLLAGVIDGMGVEVQQSAPANP